MKILSLSTHHYADGGLCKVFESTKHFRSLNGKAESNAIEVTKTSDIIKQQRKHKMPPYCSCGVYDVWSFDQ